MADRLEHVAYCGFVCTACSEALPQSAGCPGCRAGGGDPGCGPRHCCIERRIAGCWQCADFPCNEGFATDGHDPAFRGFWLASVRCLREHGVERYAAMVEARLGPPFDHAAFRSKNEEEIRQMLEGMPDASVKSNEVRRTRTRATSNGTSDDEGRGRRRGR